MTIKKEGMITNKPIKINKENIFQDDLLNRKSVIKELSGLILKTENSFVLSINSEWGTGKTTFIKLWKAYLQKEYTVKSIYFSAWEDDFSKEPLVAILGELDSFIKSNHLKDNKTIKKAFDCVKKILPSIAKTVFNTATSVPTGDVFENCFKTLLENYTTSKDNLEQLKKDIKIILRAIDPEKPFIFFIDELDRCRPLYSIELLERIKHIFNIDKLIFVLAIDKENLSKSIKSAYGDIDTNNYLRRFISLEYNLEDPSVNSFCNALNAKFKLSSIISEKAGNNYPSDTFLNILKNLSKKFKLSLRQIEQIFTKLHIIFTTASSSLVSVTVFKAELNIFSIATIFEIIKSYDDSLYYKFIKSDPEAKTRILNLINGTIDSNIVYLCHLIIHTSLSSKAQRETLFSKNSKIVDQFIKDYGFGFFPETHRDKSKHEAAVMQYKQAVDYIRALTIGWDSSETQHNINNYKTRGLCESDSFSDYVEKVIKKIEFTNHFNSD